MTSTDPSNATTTGAPAAGAPGRGDRPAFVGPSEAEQVWWDAEAATIGFVSTMNTAVAGLVDAIAVLVASEAWRGAGVRSCAHWLSWKAGMAPARARGLVAVAERREELPECWAAFEAGRLTEDAMVLLARRAPAERDAELAGLAPELMVSQLQRLLAKLPELPSGDEDEGAEASEPTPYLRLHTSEDGWGHGSFRLPPDAAELLRIGLDHARDAEYHDRTGVAPHPEDAHDSDDGDGNGNDAGGGPAPGSSRPASGAGSELGGGSSHDRGTDSARGVDGRPVRDPGASEGVGSEAATGRPTGHDHDVEPPSVDVSWVDALVRLATEGTHALDAHHRRTGRPGERAKVVLHHDLGSDGTLGPGRLHLGAVLPDPLARYLACDADVAVVSHRDGCLVGIHPATRTVPNALRRAIEDRDQGCVHPLCHQRRHLHIHHIWFWEDGGPTTPDNLVALCPTHHRALHHGELTLTGDPEAGTLTVTTSAGIPLRPPRFRPPDPADPPGAPPSRSEPPYRPASGERLHLRWLSWN